MSQQADALRSAINTLYREKQALANVVEALFQKLEHERAEAQRLYKLGYTQGLRRGMKNRLRLRR